MGDCKQANMKQARIKIRKTKQAGMGIKQSLDRITSIRICCWEYIYNVIAI